MRPLAPTLLALALTAVCMPTTSQARTPAGHPSGTAMTGSTEAFEHVNHRMHADMAIRFTGHADADFMRAMIPHHQGAIDMAKVELQYGKDPDVRKLASQVIAAQEQEIALMKRWLAEHDAAAP
jgi:uncharacterized protein (DUF305 family)